MKKLITSVLLAISLVAIVFTPACTAPHLEQGGAYAPVAADGTVAVAPDIKLYAVDGTFKVAYETIQTVFSFERQNRVLLWKFSPTIKQTLDTIRPQVVEFRDKYAKARKFYVANPTPAGLDTLQAILVEIQLLASLAQQVIPQPY